MFCKFLMYSIVFISYVFHCFYDFFIFCNLILRNCANGQKDRINTVLDIFKKSVISMVLYTICKMRILGKFWADVRVQKVASMVRFSQTWYQKMRKTWKKKVMQKACRDQRRSRRTDFVQGGGGVKLTPPPPPQFRVNNEVPLYWILSVMSCTLGVIVGPLVWANITPQIHWSHDGHVTCQLIDTFKCTGAIWDRVHATQSHIYATVIPSHNSVP